MITNALDVQDTILIHVPHAGTLIPNRLGYVASSEKILDEVKLLTDHNTDRLFNVGPEQLVCPWSRVFCDVERFVEGEEMDAVGMGFFYTACDDGSPLREDRDGARNLALSYYDAHHASLLAAVERKLQTHGQCIIIDAHSFSDKPFKRDRDQTLNRPHFCLGTTQWNTPDWIINDAKRSLGQGGSSVETNRPYGGSMIPKRYEGDKRVISLMVEVNRDLRESYAQWLIADFLGHAFG